MLKSVSVKILDVSSFRKPTFTPIIKKTVSWGNATGNSENMAGGSENMVFDDDDIKRMLSGDTIAQAEEIQLSPPSQSDINLFESDSINDFKDKIYASTGIEPYKQHIWVKKQLGYSVQPFQHIDIRSINTHKTFFEGIPVDSTWYMRKDEIKIRMDMSLLGMVKQKHGLNCFLVNIDDFLEPVKRNLLHLLKTDMYSIELIYYSFVLKYWPYMTLAVFGEYIKGTVSDTFPALTSDISKRLAAESDLLQISLGSKTRIISGVTQSTVVIFDIISTSGEVINLRNLFNSFILGNVSAIACCIRIDDRTVVLNKYAKKPCPAPKPGHMCFKMCEGDISMMLTMDDRGNYKATLTSSKGRLMQLDQTYAVVRKLAQPLIQKISKTISVSYQLSKMDGSNSKFINIGASMFWKRTISSLQFQTVVSILDKYVFAGLLVPAKSDANSIAFYLTKGMYDYDLRMFDNLDLSNNQFSYMTNASIQAKFFLSVLRKKKLTVTHRFSDVKIECTGMNEREYEFFVHFANQIFSQFPTENAAPVKVTNKLRRLKEQDPLMYEFKKVYDSPIVYSKICQKQKQPTMFSEPGKGRVKYWNFTTDEPVYYGCTNPQYPHVNYIAGVHPKSFCIPCCYKLPVPKGTTDKREIVFNKCTADRKYDEVKSAVRSKYTTSYSRHIGVDRMVQLPELSLEPLFYSASNDPECTKGEFYIYGIQQHTEHVQNVGFVYCMAFILDMDFQDFIIQSCKKIKNTWSTLMHGRAILHFSSYDDIAEKIQSTFISGGLSNVTVWNELFISIAKMWDIQIHLFKDDEPTEGGGNIYLELSPYAASFNHAKNAIVIKTGNEYHLIISSKKPTQKAIFSNNSPLVQKLHKMVKTMTRKTDEPHLQNIVEKMKVHMQFLDNSGLCYGVSASDRKYFIPIIRSNPVNLPTTRSYPDVFPTLQEIKKYAKKMGLIPEFLEHRGKITNVRISGIDHQIIPYTGTVPHALQNMHNMYKRSDVNRAIELQKPTSDRRSALEKKSLYKHYLYKIVVLEFAKQINGERNRPMRKKIIGFLNKNDVIKVRPLVNDVDFSTIVKIFKAGEYKRRIDHSIFDFDRTTMHKLKDMEHADIVKKLSTMIKPSPGEITDFPNSITACPSSYCKNGRIIISKKQLDPLLGLLASDIKNDLKREYIFNAVFMQAHVDFFEFEKRQGETISVYINDEQ